MLFKVTSLCIEVHIRLFMCNIGVPPIATLKVNVFCPPPPPADEDMT